MQALKVQSVPLGPEKMRCGGAAFVGIGNSEIVPPVSIRPIFLAVVSVNHRLPSGPAVMPASPAAGVETSKVDTCRSGKVTWLIVLAVWLTDQRLPSGPVAKASASAPVTGVLVKAI